MIVRRSTGYKHLLLCHLLRFLSIIIFIPFFHLHAAENETLLDTTLRALAMDRKDLSIRPDLFDSRYPLPLFERWMQTPLLLPGESQKMAQSLFRTAPEPKQWYRDLLQWNGIAVFSVPPTTSRPKIHIAPDLPSELKQVIELLLIAMAEADSHFKTIQNALPPQQLKLIENYFYKPEIVPGPLPPQADNPLAANEIWQAVDALHRIDMQELFNAGYDLLHSLEKAKQILSGVADWSQLESCSFITELGRVEIGGTGSDVHQDPAVLIIDLGGDDLYRGQVASGIQKCSLVIDLKGDDAYLGENETQGFGFWGIGILNDWAGNDFYKAGHGGQGAGLFGLGLLLDENGSDIYMGETFVQAAGFFGWGGLLDLHGEDIYQCHSFGQAYAETYALAVLCDLDGNDKYLSGMQSPDHREPDMHQSFSQGFSMGLRNLMAGGYALLADRSGNDFYQCQYFGQGSSYWMGIGLLYDEYGKDTYIARRYSQGAGIHFSLGALLDAEGNDHTFSWGVSQGCGHDFGIGILVNESGDDTYVADWLSMGASEANGIGIFADHSGQDGYDIKSGMAVGDLIVGRKAGGIGLFLDAGGQDRYSQKGQNNHLWSSTRWSCGLDIEGEDRASGLNLNKPSVPSPLDLEVKRINDEEIYRLSKNIDQAQNQAYPDNIGTLLAVVSQGYYLEPGKTAQEKLLAIDPEKSLPYSIANLNSPDIMHLAFFDRLFSVYASKALWPLKEKVDDPDPLVRARACSYLGMLKDTRMLDACLSASRDSSWRVRAAAARALGEMLSKERLKSLVSMRSAFQQARDQNNSDVLKHYLSHKTTVQSVCSVLARIFPLDYPIYQKWSPPLSEIREDQSREYSQWLQGRLDDLLPVLEKWIQDIRNSETAAKKLLTLLNDPDPEVARAAAFSLGQLKYRPAVPRILALLQAPHFTVRDTAALSLVLFGKKIMADLEANLATDSSSVLMLKTDIASRIGGAEAKTLVTALMNHPDPDVQRQARRSLEAIAARKPPDGVDEENGE